MMACAPIPGTVGEPCTERGICLPGLVCVSGSCAPEWSGCTNSCPFAQDGECDDGATGATSASCSFGTDCDDCGPRTSSPPSDAGMPPPLPDTGVDAGVVPMVPPVVMVEVPAGPFSMGCNSAIDSQCFSDEGALRTVDVARFAIDATEVTRAAYDACVSAGRCTAPGCSSSGPDHPVVCINWNQAVAYCQWVGKRLPTEAEWEKAARGTDGRIWPTGNTAPTCAQANLNYGCVSTGSPPTWPVGSRTGAVSPYGAFDMAGNVWEWTSDWFDAAQQFRVYRGGSWDYGARDARVSARFRFGPSVRYGSLGARCAQSF